MLLQDTAVVVVCALSNRCQGRSWLRSRLVVVALVVTSPHGSIVELHRIANHFVKRFIQCGLWWFSFHYARLNHTLISWRGFPWHRNVAQIDTLLIQSLGSGPPELAVSPSIDRTIHQVLLYLCDIGQGSVSHVAGGRAVR